MHIDSPLLLIALGSCLFVILAALSFKSVRSIIAVLAPIYESTGRIARRFVLGKSLVILVGLAIVFGLAGLSYMGKAKALSAQDMDIMIVCDDSQSMSAKVADVSRMERCRAIATDVALRFQSANIAACEFTDKAFCRAPFGSSYSMVLRVIQDFDVEAISGSGSKVTYALKQLASQFPEGTTRGRVMFFISDGGEELGAEYYHRELDSVLEHLVDQGIVVIPIAVGESYPVPLALRPISGSRERYRGEYQTTTVQEQNYEILTSQLNETKLQHIAAKTRGIYIHEDEFQTRGIDVVLPAALDEAGILRPATQSLSWVFAVVALACCWVYMFFFEPSLR